MTDEHDLNARRDDAQYWEELAQRFHGAALKEAAVRGARPRIEGYDDTRWIADRFRLASLVAVAAAATALFVVGWATPRATVQHDVGSVWGAAFFPTSVNPAITNEGAPSIAVLMISGEATGNLTDREAARSTP